MEFYKFINTYCVEKFCGDFVVIDNMIYTNPQEEQIRQLGYKELLPLTDEVPTYDAATQNLVIKYTDGVKIEQHYAIEDKNA